MFEQREFEIDPDSEEYKQLHPNAGAHRKTPQSTRVGSLPLDDLLIIFGSSNPTRSTSSCAPMLVRTAISIMISTCHDVCDLLPVGGDVPHKIPPRQ